MADGRWEVGGGRWFREVAVEAGQWEVTGGRWKVTGGR